MVKISLKDGIPKGWFRKRENVPFFSSDEKLMLINISLPYLNMGSEKEFEEKKEEAIRKAMLEVSKRTNKGVYQEHKDMFIYEDRYVGLFEGARLQILISVEKDKINSLDEKSIRSVSKGVTLVNLDDIEKGVKNKKSNAIKKTSLNKSLLGKPK